MLIDTHCHIYEEYYKNIEEIIKSMKDNIIIVSGINDTSNKEVINLCNKYDNIYGVLGIHPEDIDSITENSFKFIEQNLINPKIVGIGEIGLDYHYQKNNTLKQKEIFEKQINIAVKYNLPIVVHSREAIKDTFDILKKYDIKKILHCYSSSLEMAHEFIKINCLLGISGVITFKNSEKLKEVVKNINLEYLLIETDSPYLAPVPYRGKQNQPLYVEEVAKKIAELKNISLEEVTKITTNSALNIFKIVR